MKRIFYPFITINSIVIFFLIPMLFGGINAKAQSYTISFPNAPPTDNSPNGPLDQNDLNGQGIETGVRFHVTQSGTVTGIRFLKGTPNTGVHIAHLWTNDGATKLAEATFTETVNGWQEVAVSVHITAIDTFVASVFNDVGDYSLENGTWADQGGADYGSSPIIVLAWGNDPAHNGIYNYTNSVNGTFPNSNSGSPNYWIDVRFVPDFSLPVTFSDFRATTANSDVLLSWKTESEFNSRGFEIQRSNNNSKDWYPVSFVNGAGQSVTTKNYAYTDKSLAPGLYYYRLKQTDFDGKNTFSSIATATIGGKGNVSLFPNYPNPFSGTSTIRYDLPKAQHVRISLFDMAGREVKVLTDNVSEGGSHLVTLDAANLRRQLYLVRLQTEEGIVLTQKIVVE